MVDDLFNVLLHPDCQYFVEDFSISVAKHSVARDIGLQFSFFVVSLPGFGIRINWPCEKSLGVFPLLEFFGIV